MKVSFFYEVHAIGWNHNLGRCGRFWSWESSRLYTFRTRKEAEDFIEDSINGNPLYWFPESYKIVDRKLKGEIV